MKRLTDHLPIALLAVIAFAGSFSHVSALARRSGQDGWMAYAIAVCVDLLAVVAAEEIRRDRRLGRKATVPTFVLGIAIILTLAANLAEAQPTVWGRICAGVPAGAFLLATMLLERRSGEAEEVLTGAGKNPSELDGCPVEESPAEVLATSGKNPSEQGRSPLKAEKTDQVTGAGKLGDLLDRAREADREHRRETGRKISRDALRTALGCSTGTASVVLKELRTAS